MLRGKRGGKYLKIVFFMMLGCEVNGFFIVDPSSVHCCHVDLALHIVLWWRVCVVEVVCGGGCVCVMTGREGEVRVCVMRRRGGLSESVCDEKRRGSKGVCVKGIWERRRE